jgi:hypothetical protein
LARTTLLPIPSESRFPREASSKNDAASTTMRAGLDFASAMDSERRASSSRS